jgi:cytochrome c oxidase cbb3-type subunit 3
MTSKPDAKPSPTHDELLDHEYDGIREYNNPLPRWWLGLFYATIVFTAVYLPWHWLGYGKTGAESYREEVAAAQKTPTPPVSAASP